MLKPPDGDTQDLFNNLADFHRRLQQHVESKPHIPEFRDQQDPTLWIYRFLFTNKPHDITHTNGYTIVTNPQGSESQVAVFSRKVISPDHRLKYEEFVLFPNQDSWALQDRSLKAATIVWRKLGIDYRVRGDSGMCDDLLGFVQTLDKSGGEVRTLSDDGTRISLLPVGPMKKFSPMSYSTTDL